MNMYIVYPSALSLNTLLHFTFLGAHIQSCLYISINISVHILYFEYIMNLSLPTRLIFRHCDSVTILFFQEYNPVKLLQNRTCKYI